MNRALFLLQSTPPVLSASGQTIRQRALVRIATSLYELVSVGGMDEAFGGRTVIGDYLGSLYHSLSMQCAEAPQRMAKADLYCEAIQLRLGGLIAITTDRLDILEDARRFLIREMRDWTPATVPLTEAEAEVRFRILRLLATYLAFGTEIDSAWKEALQEQLRRWEQTVDPATGRWTGLSTAQALYRLKLFAMQRRLLRDYGREDLLARLHDACIPEAMAALSPHADSRLVELFHETLGERIRPATDWTILRSLKDSLQTLLQNPRPDAAPQGRTPGETADIRLLYHSLIIQTTAREDLTRRCGIDC
ncbi:MAG: hypothetical protein IJ721_09400 [Bacteroidales bacterium]|nr:hypothetical protein [Bacteroidales bacterium]